MSEQKKSLANGHELNQETFADFVERLRYHCRGKGVSDHCTAEAIFIVQAKRIVSGIDRQYTDKLMVSCEESAWYSPKDYWDNCDSQQQCELVRKAIDDHGHQFLLLRESDQWDVLADLPMVKEPTATTAHKDHCTKRMEPSADGWRYAGMRRMRGAFLPRA